MTLSHAIGTCKTCKTASVIEHPFSWGPISRIAPCGHLVSYMSVVAKHSDKVTCGGKCLNAKRSSCECSCDGANHGKGWAA